MKLPISLWGSGRLSAIAATSLGMILFGAMAKAEPPNVVLQNAQVRYVISATGTNQAFIDRATGRDYLRANVPSVCASVHTPGGEFPATAAALTDDRLALEFGTSGVKVALRVTPRDSFLRLTVESVTGGAVESLVFLNVPLTLQARPEDPFGACALSLNLQTRVDALPALQRDLRASCQRKFGLVGSQVAIIAVPTAKILATLKEVLTEADEMPHCPVAGPWASEVRFNHGSYLFNFGALTESTVDEWSAMARSLGVTQIDNHGGSGFFRFGDFVLNPQKWPGGWETYRNIVQRLHERGIDSIFHTYAFFIDKQSKYVRPIPDSRLDAFRSFKLAEALSADATELVVEESTKGLSTVTGFFEHNSVVLHLDDELITFSTVSQEAPGRFGGLKRGAFGTTPSAHPKGTKARHLKECFGLFVPDVESSLFTEIARNHAEIVNTCGFDGIYLDAIDGSSILRGPDECWYWADQFVFEIQRHLKKPVGMEMSAMWHHFWQYRTRWQAWDYPQRGQKRFIDLHAESVNGGLMLPLHLGWWNFQVFDPPQIEPTYPDVVEYLGAKLIGWDAGISMTGAIDPARLKSVPLIRQAVDLLRRYEELRRLGSFSEAIRAKLREPDGDFSLVQGADERWRFRPRRIHSQGLAAGEPWTLSWQVENSFETQPLRFRLEALMSTSAYDDPTNLTLADFSAPATFAGLPRTAAGVLATLRSLPASADNAAAGMFAATNSGQVPRKGAWVRLDRKFDPPLNLKKHQALGVAIEGDGLGEILAVRLESPSHLSFGAVADRYLTIDFTGRRTFSLVETESTRWSDYVWNDGKSLYNLYRESIDFSKVDAVSVWLNNLPDRQEARCTLGAVKALQMIPGVVRHPTVILNGQSLDLPVDISSGGYLELDEEGSYVLHGPKGELLNQVKLPHPTPALRPGMNQVQFSFQAGDGPPPRARLVTFSHGRPIE